MKSASSPSSRKMMKNRKMWLAMPLMSIALSGGCGGDPEALGTLREVVNTVSQKSTGLAKDENATATALDGSKSFTPPYPDRIDPFDYPGTERTARSDSVASVGEIQVLGFANVGHDRVLLRSKNNTRSLSVGDKFDGVEVVAINPPRVELQMGTLVWTATMFDKSR